MLNTVSLPSITLVFLAIWIQFYWIRSLMGLSTNLIRLFLVSLFQTLTTIFLMEIIPHPAIRLFLLACTSISYQMWIFQTNLFPSAFFGVIGPILLGFMGELFLTTLCLNVFDTSTVLATLGGTVQPPFVWTALLPSVALAIFFWLKPQRKQQRTSRQTRISLDYYLFFLPIVLLHKIIAFIFHNYQLDDLFFGNLFYYAGYLILPVFCLSLFQYAQGTSLNKKIMQYQVHKFELQESALRLLREERHDLLNELTLISTYLQMEKWEEAQSCLAYTAANLSDRYNYATLPHDAWLTVLDFKQKEAQQRQIQFEILIEADPPQDFNECRLLPKLIFNLVDNAFQAASRVENPYVQLRWGTTADKARFLTVTNNGHPISPTEGLRIFRGGFTSKQNLDQSHGWGLAICLHIAEELGGSLTYHSTKAQTEFRLSLPRTAPFDTPHSNVGFSE